MFVTAYVKGATRPNAIVVPQLVLSAPERDEEGYLKGFTARASGKATGDFCPDWYGDVSNSEQIELVLTANMLTPAAQNGMVRLPRKNSVDDPFFERR